MLHWLPINTVLFKELQLECEVLQIVNAQMIALSLRWTCNRYLRLILSTKLLLRSSTLIKQFTVLELAQLKCCRNGHFVSEGNNERYNYMCLNIFSEN